jgi:hypothetical protein
VPRSARENLAPQPKWNCFGGPFWRGYFFPALFAAQRAFNAATILARPSGLSLPLFFVGEAAGALATLFDFAQRARCAAAILARASADIVRLPGFAAGTDTALGAETTEPPPPTSFDLFSNGNGFFELDECWHIQASGSMRC